MSDREPPGYRALRLLSDEPEDDNSPGEAAVHAVASEAVVEQVESVSDPHEQAVSVDRGALERTERSRPGSLLEAEADIGRPDPTRVEQEREPLSPRRRRLRIALVIGVVASGGLMIASQLTDGFGGSLRGQGSDGVIDLPPIVIEPAQPDPSLPGSGSAATDSSSSLPEAAPVSLADAESYVAEAAAVLEQALPQISGAMPQTTQVAAFLSGLLPIAVEAEQLYGNDQPGVLYVSVTPLKRVIGLRIAVEGGEAARDVDIP